MLKNSSHAQRYVSAARRRSITCPLRGDNENGTRATGSFSDEGIGNAPPDCGRERYVASPTTRALPPTLKRALLRIAIRLRLVVPNDHYREGDKGP